MSDSNALVKSWVDFLSVYPWDWFVTLTFRDRVHPEHAEKCFKLWINDLNCILYGRYWPKKNLGVYWVKASEFQRRGVLHFHCLMSGRGADLNHQARRLSAMDRWFELAGIARIEPPRTGAVVNYVSKYVAKEGDLELSETFRHMQLYGGNRFGVTCSGVMSTPAATVAVPIVEAMQGETQQ